ncbi:MAG: LytR C-terminal domain-containing protein [Candidatus Peribacteria bacterium]|jgi:sugar/nucleoside kinase (ribokinase family)|nr:LytR C-terminal domain-containing protein [Candidatus Peribacteria bacterium]
MSSTPFAGQIAVKLKRYGFNITSTTNTETPSSGSYLILHTEDPREATIAAIQTLLPLTDIRYDTGNLLTGIDENGNLYSYLT